MHETPRTLRKLDQFTLILGGVALVGLVFAGWIPQSCPLLRKTLMGCPVVHLAKPMTYAQKEFARVPYQKVEGTTLQFSVPSQDNHAKAKIDFFFISEHAEEVSYLELATKNHHLDQLALITAPILSKLSGWPEIRTPDVTLYLHPDDPITSIDDFLQNLPPLEEVAADSAAAQVLHLRTDQYTLLDHLTSADGFKYVLSSAGTIEKDGLWSIYTKTVDTSQAEIGTDNQMEWIIDRLDGSGGTPFNLGTVHVNFINTD
jgi:hypothetical protein